MSLKAIALLFSSCAIGAGALQPSPTDDWVYVIIVLEEPVVSLGDSALQRKTAIRLQQDSMLDLLDAEDFTPVYQYETVAALTGWLRRSSMDDLPKTPGVVAVGPDAMGRGQLDTTRVFLGIDEVERTYGLTGAGVTVALLDSGVDTDHPDLTGDIAPGGVHFLSGGGDQGEGAEDEHGHGTMMAGILTSSGAVAPRGIAPDVAILPIKVLNDENIGWVSDWARAVEHVNAVREEYDYLFAINMSLATFESHDQCPCDTTDAANILLQGVIEQARENGILTFAASGFTGSCTSMASPACLSATIGVGAVHDLDLGRVPAAGAYRAYFGSLDPVCCPLGWFECFDASTGPDQITCTANRGPCLSLLAPAGSVTTSAFGGGVRTVFGTHGMHLTKEMCDGLVRNRLSSITISFSGATRDDYENVYLGGDFKRVLSGIKLLSDRKQAQKSNFPLIAINSLAFKHHVSKLPEFVEMMGCAGVNVIHLKPLQTYDLIPELHAHAAVARPDADQVVIEAARQIARRHGVVLATGEYDATSSALPEREILRARHKGQQPLSESLLPINTLKSLAASKKIGGAMEKPLRKAFEQEVHVMTRTSMKSFEADDVYCMEPFKTFYVRYDGSIKPCCFGSGRKSLGALSEKDALSIWSSDVWLHLRDGVLRNKYSNDFCKPCVKAGVYPKDHGLAHKVKLYSDWFKAVFGVDFAPHLHEPLRQLPGNKEVVRSHR